MVNLYISIEELLGIFGFGCFGLQDTVSPLFGTKQARAKQDLCNVPHLHEMNLTTHSALIRNLIKLKDTAKLTAQGE